MSTLRHERLGTDIPEPDSELRAALQRVARDLEQDGRHLGQDQNLDLQQDKHGEGLHRIRHGDGASIHVEDILDQSALEELDVEDVTPYGMTEATEAHDESSHHIHRLSPQSSSTPVQQSPRIQRSDESSNPTLRIGEPTDGRNGGTIQSLLGCTPTIGFMKFLDDWLETQGLKSADGPSPVREAWKLLDTAQRSGHDARARFEFDIQRSSTANSGQPRGTPRSSGGSAGNRRSKRDAAGTDRGVDGMRREMSVEDKKTVDGFVKDIVQQLDILYQVSGTNYLLLTAPVFQPADTFPVLSHSPPAEGFWQGLRGGPGTNLTKFLALSHPAVTSRRLAIPSGERSLDVKSRLNASMRQMIREASNVADAEMKWTRPESLVQIYGVKIVGWPMGGPEEGDEAVPMRNPSNNSVAQNKLLLSRIEAGVLRVEAATDDDRCLAFGNPSLPADLQDSPRTRDLRAELGKPAGSTGAVNRQNEGETDYMRVSTSNQGRTAEPTVSTDKDLRPTKFRDIAPSAKIKYRSKSLLTLNPDGSIRPGGLEGKRGPGRPRKEMPVSAEELPHLTTSYEYHANQRRMGNDQGPSPDNLAEMEDQNHVEDVAKDCQDIYVQNEELHEANPDLALLMGPTNQHPAERSSHQYPHDPEAPDHHHRRSSEAEPSHRDSDTPLGQALSHIEYYHVTGPNFGGRANLQSSLPRPHVLNNIAPHFPLPPPGHRDPSHQSMNQEEQQYLSDFGSRMPVIGSYSAHFPGQAGQVVDPHDPWNEQRDSSHTSSHSDSMLPEGNHSSIQHSRHHHVHHTQMDDNPDIVDGIDMEAAFGNPHILAVDSLGDRGGVGEMAELQMRSFLEGQSSHAEPDDGMDMDGHHLKGKRKADEMMDPGESDTELRGILKRREEG